MEKLKESHYITEVGHALQIVEDGSFQDVKIEVDLQRQYVWFWGQGSIHLI